MLLENDLSEIETSYFFANFYLKIVIIITIIIIMMMMIIIIIIIITIFTEDITS